MPCCTPLLHPCCTPLMHTLDAPFAAHAAAPSTLLHPLHLRCTPHLHCTPRPTAPLTTYHLSTPPTNSLLQLLSHHSTHHLTTLLSHYDYPCRLPTVLAGRQARQDARRHLRAAGAAERHLDRRQQEACAHRRRPGCRGATGQGGGRGGEPRKAREAPRGRLIYLGSSSALHVLLHTYRMSG